MNRKNMRMRRLLSPKGSLIVAADHGFSTPEIGSMWDMEQYFGKVSLYIDGIILHKGTAQHLLNSISKTDVALIVHTSGASQYASNNYKVPVCSVIEAIKLGADAVSVHVNFNTEMESEMLANLASISKDASTFGVPLMCMCYFPTSSNIKIDDIKHAARMCYEIGVDMVKVNFDSSQEFLDFNKSFPLPIFIAGGEPQPNLDEASAHFTSLAKNGMKYFTIGRNIFTSDQPEKLLQIIRHEMK